VIVFESEKALESTPLETEYDVVRIRQMVRFHARECGVGLVDQTRLTTAASEILRNMYVYANGGKATISRVDHAGRSGLCITCVDEGPGIVDLELAMQDGYSTGNSLGSGLPGARRLVDLFDVETKVGAGTTVQLVKYL
jgi:serine/threonine-protein kinase RsbT